MMNMATNNDGKPRNFVRQSASVARQNSPAYTRIQTDMALALGEQLVAWRHAAMLTQDEMGELIGVSGAQISGWERGRKPILEARIPDIARALNISQELLTKTILKFSHPILYAGLFGRDDVSFLAPILPPTPPTGRKKR